MVLIDWTAEFESAAEEGSRIARLQLDYIVPSWWFLRNPSRRPAVLRRVRQSRKFAVLAGFASVRSGCRGSADLLVSR